MALLQLSKGKRAKMIVAVEGMIMMKLCYKVYLKLTPNNRQILQHLQTELSLGLILVHRHQDKLWLVQTLPKRPKLKRIKERMITTPGKTGNSEVFFDLLNLRIDSGDKKLKTHLEKCHRNAVYTSPKIQNGLIHLCGEVIRDNIISDVIRAINYAVLADETADIAGKEQLSIGLRFYDEKQGKIREEFVGFMELKAQDASSIAEAIDKFLVSHNLSPQNCVGYGFDGCSTMAGKEGGVQAILRKKYTRALFFHCSSHKLNLVVNDANNVPEIRNTQEIRN
ncbi:hypothetical protein NQ315_002603 [Exocentrus adspersus]|uniref:DUF4371 domain-containing protein n=1 Tax=Exocentrus adspersus TaxID=1586481 RepID=A0AAV8VUW0_9CUCU|nr:hypothetical protein NQ315_002603 [Exocentrus adspersus]